MKPFAVAIALLIAVVGGAFVVSSRNGPSLADPVPNMTVMLTSGEIRQLYDYQGKPTVLHFWATWCAPCVKEFPSLLRLAKEHPEWQLVLISADEKVAPIAPFMQKMEDMSGIPLGSMPQLVQVWDEGKRISQDTFQVVSYPETIFLSPNMRPVHKVVGAITPEDWPR
jgi:thiol-disulfide isomerase/thioredoxin